ncbi:acetylglutamate kinase [Xanthomonadaceae bacterium JHOS43]|nr:acetylglutamate kinase [Xanthomonadaceae bacterium JHOS43]MCX7563850.1 acetylglutamate kinase [Xanthomonadaceae bacterium XH05]
MNIEINKQTRQTIVKLLSNMGSAKEIDQYLKRFSELDAKRFAVIKVGGAILRDDMEALVSSLSFLQQVGLTPIVIHGAGPQLDEQLQAAGIEKRMVDGLRYTGDDSLSIVRKVMVRENMNLVSELHAQSVHATSITTNVFEAEFLDQDKHGLVGKVVRVDTSAIEAAIRIGAIPVIASLGVTHGGQYLNVNADWAANELIKTLKPYKIVFLTGTGGLLDEQGRLIESINLTTEYDELMAQPWINGGMRVKVEQIKQLLDALPLTSSVSMTRPDQLAKELFTHRGSGTMLRRGERVLSFDSWEGVDLERMRELIESSFGRKLLPDYFTRTRPHRVYVSETYRAAMILTQEEGFAYLDKFAVLDEAQGEGLGRAVWNVAREQNPRMFWRSRHNNQVNIFYYAQSDGCYKQDKWKVFWYGIQDFRDIERCVAHCRSRPATLEG